MLITPCDTILPSKTHKMVSAWTYFREKDFTTSITNLKVWQPRSWNTRTPLGNPANLRVISLNKLHFILFNLYDDIGLFTP